MENEVISLTAFNLFYKLTDFPKEDFVLKNGTLTIKKSQTITQEMVANGYRENFEYEVIDTFIFKGLKIENQKVKTLFTNMNEIIINGIGCVPKEIEHIKEYID